MLDSTPLTTPRVLGTETEFGIASRDASAVDPISNSLAVIGHYPGISVPHAVWDYENENPLLDARGFEVEGERERPNPDYNRQLNKVLANGGRLCTLMAPIRNIPRLNVPTPVRSSPSSGSVSGFLPNVWMR